jgi:hypothetical protein
MTDTTQTPAAPAADDVPGLTLFGHMANALGILRTLAPLHDDQARQVTDAIVALREADQDALQAIKTSVDDVVDDAMSGMRDELRDEIQVLAKRLDDLQAKLDELNAKAAAEPTLEAGLQDGPAGQVDEGSGTAETADTHQGKPASGPGAGQGEGEGSGSTITQETAAGLNQA